MEKEKMPVHVALIPDGNRRWAKEKGLKATAGHLMSGSYKNISSLFREAKGLGVRYVSIWGFSTDNWKRDKNEVEEILGVVSKGLSKFLEKVHEEKVGFRHVGRKDRLPAEVVEKIAKLERESEKYTDFVALLCLDYGGRDEIVRAVRKVAKGEVSEEEFLNCLDTTGIPEPDLIIRTGGEKRLSGFMPFQSIYSEIIFSDLFFPDFGPEQLRDAVEEFSKRSRRFGE